LLVLLIYICSFGSRTSATDLRKRWRETLQAIFFLLDFKLAHTTQRSRLSRKPVYLHLFITWVQLLSVVFARLAIHGRSVSEMIWRAVGLNFLIFNGLKMVQWAVSCVKLFSPNCLAPFCHTDVHLVWLNSETLSYLGT